MLGKLVMRAVQIGALFSLSGAWAQAPAPTVPSAPPAPSAAAAALPAVASVATTSLPAELQAALQRARIPSDALSLVVQEVGSPRSLLQHQPQLALNPASVVKLLPTAMALDQLGPAWTWTTPVWLQGKLEGGVLEGRVYIKGTGDPKLVYERLWLLLRRVMQLGVRELRGDFVLDTSAFAPPESAAGDFDGEGQRAYNVRANALLMNYHAVVYTFTPDPARGVAVVQVEPPLSTPQVDSTVPLSNGPCTDWTAQLKVSFTSTRTRFGGSYPSSCGELVWPLADAAPATYNQRLVEGLWREMGGRLVGSVREGAAPSDVKPSFEQRSPPLVEVVREINKFSNNVMAQQLFLTLALQRGRLGVAPGAAPIGAATPEAARDALRRWVADRLGEQALAELVIDNGSGLSRQTRVSAHTLARLLQLAHTSPWMSEFMSSLPIAGTDGTLRRARGAVGRAQLKTGSLRDVASRAGYVLTEGGRRYVVVATLNHPNVAGGAAQSVFDALLHWLMREGDKRGSTSGS